MAGKPQKKAARKKVKPSGPAPCAVLWGLDPSSEKGEAVRSLLRDMGVVARTALPERRHAPYKVGARYGNSRQLPQINLSLRRADQLSQELLRQRPDLVYLPAEELAAHPDAVKKLQEQEIPVAAVLPRVCFDRELDQLRQALEQCRALGVGQALLGNLGLMETARGVGMTLRGDFGLQVFNSQAAKEYKRMGFESLTASFELKLAQVRDLSKAVDTELIAYGRLPLMITENCVVKNRFGRCVCDNALGLTDRKGMQFPVLKAFGCRNEIFNGNKLFLADRAQDYQRAGLWAIRLCFTTENAKECARVLERYRGEGTYVPNNYTRGLYYRDVE